ncbi:MAG: flavin reductase family protein [Candidatus Magasanikiibacteriota bacterium]
MKQIDISTAFTKYIPYNFAFVLSCDKNNKPSGMIVAWHTKVSHEPPLMAVSIYNTQNTKKLIEQSKEFVLAVPNKKQLKAISIFGENHGDKIDKFKLSKIKTTKAKFLKTPLLAEATLNYECEVIKKIKAGDHTIFIGKVLSAHYNEKEKILLCYGKGKNGKRIFKEL